MAPETPSSYPEKSNLVLGFVGTDQCLHVSRDKLGFKSIRLEAMLSSRSLASSSGTNSCITIRDYDLQTFQTYLDFLYTGQVTITDFMIEPLYSLGWCYIDASLVERIEEYIEQRLRQDIEYFATFSPNHRTLYSSLVRIKLTNLSLLYQVSTKFHEQSLYERCESFTEQQFETENMADAYLESRDCCSEELRQRFETWTQQTTPSVQSCANLLGLAVQMENMNDVIFRVELFILVQLNRAFLASSKTWIDFPHLELFLTLTLKHDLVSVQGQFVDFVDRWALNYLVIQKVDRLDELVAKLKRLYEIALDCKYKPPENEQLLSPVVSVILYSGKFTTRIEEAIVLLVRSGVIQQQSWVCKLYQLLVDYECGGLRSHFEEYLLGVPFDQPFKFSDIVEIFRLAHQHGRLDKEETTKNALFKRNLVMQLTETEFKDIDLSPQNSDLQFLLKLSVDCEMTELESLLASKLILDQTTLDSVYNLARDITSEVLRNKCNQFILNKFGTTPKWTEMLWLFELAKKYASNDDFVTELQNLICLNIRRRPNEWNPVMRSFETDQLDELLAENLADFSLTNKESIESISQLCSTAIHQLSIPMNRSMDNIVFRFDDIDRCLPVSRDELSNKSARFAAMLSSRWRVSPGDNSIHIGDTDYFTFAAYLEFLHSGHVYFTGDLIESVHFLAHCYLEDSLKEYCEQYIENQLRSSNLEYWETFSKDYKYFYSNYVQINLTNLALLYQLSTKFNDLFLYERCEEFTLKQFNTDNMVTAFQEAQSYFSKKLRQRFEEWTKKTAASVQSCVNLLALASEMNIDGVEYRVEFFILLQLTRANSLLSNNQTIDMSHLKLYFELTLAHEFVSVYAELREYMSSVLVPADMLPTDVWPKLRPFYEISLDYFPSNPSEISWSEMIQEWVYTHIEIMSWREQPTVHLWYRELIDYEPGLMRRMFEFGILEDPIIFIQLDDLDQICHIAYQHGGQGSDRLRMNLEHRLMIALPELALEEIEVGLDAQDANVKQVLKVSVDCELSQLQYLIVNKLTLNMTTLESVYSLAHQTASKELLNRCNHYVLDQFGTASLSELIFLCNISLRNASKDFFTEIQEAIRVDASRRPKEWDPIFRYVQGGNHEEILNQLNHQLRQARHNQ